MDVIKNTTVRIDQCCKEWVVMQPFNFITRMYNSSVHIFKALTRHSGASQSTTMTKNQQDMQAKTDGITEKKNQHVLHGCCKQLVNVVSCNLECQHKIWYTYCNQK